MAAANGMKVIACEETTKSGAMIAATKVNAPTAIITTTTGRTTKADIIIVMGIIIQWIGTCDAR